MTNKRTIPTINISAYLDPESGTEAKQEVIQEVKNACSTYGFLQVKGHGVPVKTQRGMLRCCKVLFNLPIEQKEALSLKNNASRRSDELVSINTDRADAIKEAMKR
jgi:isopenicillin N synthase-like dioxygenase